MVYCCCCYCCWLLQMRILGITKNDVVVMNDLVMILLELLVKWSTHTNNTLTHCAAAISLFFDNPLKISESTNLLVQGCEIGWEEVKYFFWSKKFHAETILGWDTIFFLIFFKKSIFFFTFGSKSKLF